MKDKVKDILNSRRVLSSKKKEWEAVGNYEGKVPVWKSVGITSIVFFVAFFAAFLSSSLLTPQKPSFASESSATASANGYFINIKSDDVGVELLTTATPTMTVVSSAVKAATNSPSGYKLYLGMSPEDASGNEKSATDKQKNSLYLDGNLSRTDGAVINAVAGSASNPTTDNLHVLTDNTWGYAVDKNNDGLPGGDNSVWKDKDHSTMYSATPSGDKYAAVPAVGSEDLIQQTDSANVPKDTDPSSVPDDKYTTANIYYGVRSNATQASGTYSNTIAYSAVAQAGPDSTITFDPAVYEFDTDYEQMVWDDEVVIQTPIFTNMSDLGSATVTFSGGPQSVTDLACGNPSLSLKNGMIAVVCTLPQAHGGEYNVEVKLTKFNQTFTGTYTYKEFFLEMQDHDNTMQCVNAAVGSEFVYIDTRDENVYTAKKLADGKCWMTQNLRLNGSISAEDLNSENTNVLPGSTFSLSASDSGTWCTDDSAACDNQSMTLDTGNSSYGTYYNWYAATAGAGKYETTSGNISASICPRGWRLPTGSSSGEFQALYNQYPSPESMLSGDGPAFVLSGDRSGNSTANQGYASHYWTSTAFNSDIAYNLLLLSSSANPADAYYKNRGFTVRCVADDRSISDISDMQEMTPTICDNTDTGAAATLTDSRDGNTYTVKKLNDGRCWMTQNLNLTAPTKGYIDETDSNVDSKLPDTGTWNDMVTNNCAEGSNTTFCVANNSNGYGAMYSWYAATATSGNSEMTSTTAPYSVCPKGWRLPSGGTNGEFVELSKSYNNDYSAMLDSAGPNFLLGGIRNGTVNALFGIYGYFWSGTNQYLEEKYANNLYMMKSSQSVLPEGEILKFYGMSVRCVAQK